jgi:hypothetical protein
MSNLFQKLGVGVSDFGKWLATAVKDTVSIASRIEKILKAEQPLAKPFVSSLSTVVAERRGADRLLRIRPLRKGSQLLRRLADLPAVRHPHRRFQKLAPVVEEAVSILEDKTPAVN